jgi:cation transport ATPase
LHCAQEAALLKQEIARLPGVRQLSIDVVQSRMTAEYDPAVMTVEQLARTVAATGMRCAEWTAHGEGAAAYGSWWQRHGRAAMTLSSGALLHAGLIAAALYSDEPWWQAVFVHEHGHGEHEVEMLPMVLLGLAVVTGLWYLLPAAVRSLRRRVLDMPVLVTASALGAAGLGEWSEAAAPAFLFSLAHWIQARSLEKVRRLLETHRLTATHAHAAAAEEFVERFARWYTPAVLALALAVAVFAPLFGWQPWREALNTSLAVLLAACPCALVMSAPVPLAAAISGLARNGIIVTGGDYLEAIAKQPQQLAQVKEARGIVLIGDEPGKEATLLAHARRTFAAVKQNVALTMLLKGGFLLSAALGHGSLWLAALSDVGAVILVILNGVRMARVRVLPGGESAGAVLAAAGATSRTETG